MRNKNLFSGKASVITYNDMVIVRSRFLIKKRGNQGLRLHKRLVESQTNVQVNTIIGCPQIPLNYSFKCANCLTPANSNSQRSLIDCKATKLTTRYNKTGESDIVIIMWLLLLCTGKHFDSYSRHIVRNQFTHLHESVTPGIYAP